MSDINLSSYDVISKRIVNGITITSYVPKATEEEKRRNMQKVLYALKNIDFDRIRNQ